MGIKVSHSRPYHPQTQGKDERFHRTLNAEVLKGHVFHNLALPKALRRMATVYNLERPHEAIGMAIPLRYGQPAKMAC